MRISLGDGIAILALLFSAYATWITRRFNRRQESLIEGQEKLNALLLKKETHDSALANQADLGASFIKIGQGNYRLKIFNKGRAAAHNVHLEFPEGNSVVIESEIEDKFPLEALDAHQSVELIAAISMESPRKFPVKLTWSDAHSQNNEKAIYLTL